LRISLPLLLLLLLLSMASCCLTVLMRLPGLRRTTGELHRHILRRSAHRLVVEVLTTRLHLRGSSWSALHIHRRHVLLTWRSHLRREHWRVSTMHLRREWQLYELPVRTWWSSWVPGKMYRLTVRAYQDLLHVSSCCSLHLLYLRPALLPRTTVSISAMLTRKARRWLLTGMQDVPLGKHMGRMAWLTRHHVRWKARHRALWWSSMTSL